MASKPVGKVAMVVIKKRGPLDVENLPDDKGIDLKTPMVLQPPVKIRIRSPKQFLVWRNGDPFNESDTVNPKFINHTWKDVTVRISDKSVVISSEDSPIKLVPEYTLDETFIERWNNLPAEIKAMIISENTTCRVRPNYLTRYTTFETHFYPYCRTTPEITRLATEAFYKKNEWLIQLDSTLDAIVHYNFNRYPSRTLNHLIRRLCITMYIRPVHIRFLRRLSNGTLGFENLKHLAIMVQWTWPPTAAAINAWYNFMSQADENPIIFACEGIVVIERASAGCVMSGSTSLPNIEDKKVMLQERILFRGGKARSEKLRVVGER